MLFCRKPLALSLHVIAREFNAGGRVDCLAEVSYASEIDLVAFAGVSKVDCTNCFNNSTAVARVIGVSDNPDPIYPGPIRHPSITNFLHSNIFAFTKTLLLGLFGLLLNMGSNHSRTQRYMNCLQSQTFFAL